VGPRAGLDAVVKRKIARPHPRVHTGSETHPASYPSKSAGA